MKKVWIFLILCSSFFYCSDKSPIVTVLGKNGIWLTGTIKEYNKEEIIVSTNAGRIGENITIESGDT